MSNFVKAKDCFFSRLKSLTRFQRFNQTLHPQIHPEAGMGSDNFTLQVNMKKGKKVDARTFGIHRSLIPQSSWSVLHILKYRGYQVYLVGGCVRDLILKKVPKDFDVITTAKLEEVKKQFHRAIILGKRFPICQVHIKGSIIEVASFETVAKTAERTQQVLPSQMPRGCDEDDLLRWENSMHRDFTINSLFFDPFSNKIYDYTNGIEDLRSSKLRTVIPAHLSFEEDCARMLRGLRIAARLGLSLTKDTETAIHKLSSSIEKLDQFRLMLELNYMLSYGAAEPSILLLHRFNLLEMLLPFHAAYLNNQTSKARAQNSKMLMKLLSNLDKLVSCDRHAHCTLWIGILGFHRALVSNPQDGLVIWVFASVLYHGNWKEGVEFARKHAKGQVKFVPEISGFAEIESDDELAEKVTKLASLVQDSANALTETDSGLVVVPKRVVRAFCRMLEVLVFDIESYERGRESLSIDYRSLGKGNPVETRFVLGEIILETLSDGLIPRKEKKHQQLEFIEENLVKNQSVVRKNKRHGQLEFTEESLVNNQSVLRKNKRRDLATPDSEPKPDRAKKQKLLEKNCPSFEQKKLADNLMAFVNEGCQQIAKEHPKVVEANQLPKRERNATEGNKVEKEDRQPLAEEVIGKKIDKREKEAIKTNQLPKRERNATEGNKVEKEDRQPLAEEVIGKKIDKREKEAIKTNQLPKRERNATEGNKVEKEDRQPLAEEVIGKKIHKREKKAVKTNNSIKPLSSLFR